MIALIASLAAIGFSVMNPDLARQMACPAFMSSILILGMPHGTVDPLLLCSKKHAARWLAVKSRGRWIAGYLGLAAAFGIAWLFAPLICLTAFLMLTAFHWGTSEYSRSGLARWQWWTMGLTRGAIVVVGVLALRPSDSAEVISKVTGSSLVLPIVPLQVLLTVTAIAHFGALISAHHSAPSLMIRRMIDSALVIMLLAFCPALLGMAVYYVFFHSERYFRFFQGETGQFFGVTHAMCGLLFVILATVIAGFQWADWFGMEALPIHFMILAALTLPHALLVWQLQRHELRIPSSQPVTI